MMYCGSKLSIDAHNDMDIGHKQDTYTLHKVIVVPTRNNSAC